MANGTVVGNGNLYYSVSQDIPNSKHTVRWESYTSFNMPNQILFGSLLDSTRPVTSTVANRTLTFVYGPEHQRIKQQVQLASNAPSNLQAGTTWYLNGEDSLGLSYEKEIKTNGITEHKHYISAGGMVFALQVTRSGSINNADPLKAASTANYLHQDYLGSVVAISNVLGVVTERMAFDPWGKRRNTNGTADTSDSLVGQTTDRGFTMHEHLDEVGVIHMNGRVYDPLIGRFMSADPIIQAPDNLQSYNRFAYVMNNPLNFTDPTGFSRWTRFRDRVLRPVIAIVVAYYTGGAVSGFLSGAAGVTGATAYATQIAIISGAAGGFAGGVVSSGTLKGGLQGALTGGLFGGVGASFDAGSFGSYAGHAATGCISAVAAGGACGPGAASALFGKFTSNVIGDSSIVSGDFARGVATVVAGGVGSEIGRAHV